MTLLAGKAGNTGIGGRIGKNAPVKAPDRSSQRGVVSKFDIPLFGGGLHSCVGHAISIPESPDSAKHYEGWR